MLNSFLSRSPPRHWGQNALMAVHDCTLCQTTANILKANFEMICVLNDLDQSTCQLLGIHHDPSQSPRQIWFHRSLLWSLISRLPECFFPILHILLLLFCGFPRAVAQVTASCIAQCGQEGEECRRRPAVVVVSPPGGLVDWQRICHCCRQIESCSATVQTQRQCRPGDLWYPLVGSREVSYKQAHSQNPAWDGNKHHPAKSRQMEILCAANKNPH